MAMTLEEAINKVEAMADKCDEHIIKFEKYFDYESNLWRGKEFYDILLAALYEKQFVKANQESVVNKKYFIKMLNKIKEEIPEQRLVFDFGVRQYRLKLEFTKIYEDKNGYIVIQDMMS